MAGHAVERGAVLDVCGGRCRTLEGQRRWKHEVTHVLRGIALFVRWRAAIVERSAIERMPSLTTVFVADGGSLVGVGGVKAIDFAVIVNKRWTVSLSSIGRDMLFKVDETNPIQLNSDRDKQFNVSQRLALDSSIPLQTDDQGSRVPLSLSQPRLDN